MMRAAGRWPRTLPVLALFAATACASAWTDQGSPLAGCYQFERGEGASRLGLPWGVVVTDEPLEAGWPLVERFEGVRLAVTAMSATGRADHPFGYWRPVAGDSLEVGHPGGGGVVLTLAPAGQDLVGVGRPAGDALRPGQAPGPRPPAPVVARRVLCGAT